MLPRGKSAGPEKCAAAGMFSHTILRFGMLVTLSTSADGTIAVTCSGPPRQPNDPPRIPERPPQVRVYAGIARLFAPGQWFKSRESRIEQAILAAVSKYKRPRVVTGPEEAARDAIRKIRW